MAESLCVLGLVAKVQARENCPAAQRMICWKYYWGSVGDDLRRSKQTHYGHPTKKDAGCLSLIIYLADTTVLDELPGGRLGIVLVRK